MFCVPFTVVPCNLSYPSSYLCSLSMQYQISQHSLLFSPIYNPLVFALFVCVIILKIYHFLCVCAIVLVAYVLVS